MVMQSLVSFIQENLYKGYDINTIRNHLITHGYRANDVEDAINFVYRNYYKSEVKHTINLSKPTIAAIATIALILAVALPSLFFYFSSGNVPSELLDVNLESIKTTVKPGEDISFIMQISNLGQKKRYDVEIRHELIDQIANSVLTFKEETKAIETLGTAKVSIAVPESAEPGNYILKSTAKYKDGIAKATLPVKVYKEAEEETCFDNIKNQDEEDVDCGGNCNPCQSCDDGIQNGNEKGVDCGGNCNPCKECPSSCDDNNPCTNDFCSIATNYDCLYTPKQMCCGNEICEDGEDNSNCAEDCKSEQGNEPEEPFPELNIFEKIDKIAEISKKDPEESALYCPQLKQDLYKNQCYTRIAENSKQLSYCILINENRTQDECYISVAKLTNKVEICETIQKSSRRDSCYMNFVMAGDYQICERIDNGYLKQACLTLRDNPELKRELPSA